MSYQRYKQNHIRRPPCNQITAGVQCKLAVLRVQEVLQSRALESDKFQGITNAASLWRASKYSLHIYTSERQENSQLSIFLKKEEEPEKISNIEQKKNKPAYVISGWPRTILSSKLQTLLYSTDHVWVSNIYRCRSRCNNIHTTGYRMS